MWIGEEVLVDNLRKKEQKCKIEVGKKEHKIKKYRKIALISILIISL